MTKIEKSATCQHKACNKEFTYKVSPNKMGVSIRVYCSLKCSIEAIKAKGRRELKADCIRTGRPLPT